MRIYIKQKSGIMEISRKKKFDVVCKNLVRFVRQNNFGENEVFAWLTLF